MNETGKKIVQQLFGTSSIDEVNPKTIEQIVSRYPYFGPAQFLLAKKLTKINDHSSESQLQKAALYFTNPYWLNYLLTEELIEEDETLSTGENNNETIDEVVKTEQETVVNQPTEEFVSENETLSTTGNIIETSEEIIPTEQETVVNESIAEPFIITEIKTPEEEEVVHDLIPGEEVTITEEKITSPGIEPIEDDTKVLVREEPAETEITEEIIEEEEEYLPVVQEDESDPQRLKLSSIIEQHLADFKKPVEQGQELPIKSNPFHTVDYFASQGIRADGADKLTHRVKKFTDWLKQMKTPNAVQPTDLGTDVETEKLIETIAQTSNETREIVTEAMAEVLVKQGKTEKALQLYKKLSFLNPAKSTYFAAKIEDLNSK